MKTKGAARCSALCLLPDVARPYRTCHAFAEAPFCGSVPCARQPHDPMAPRCHGSHKVRSYNAYHLAGQPSPCRSAPCCDRRVASMLFRGAAAYRMLSHRAFVRSSGVICPALALPRTPSGAHTPCAAWSSLPPRRRSAPANRQPRDRLRSDRPAPDHASSKHSAPSLSR